MRGTICRLLLWIWFHMYSGDCMQVRISFLFKLLQTHTSLPTLRINDSFHAGQIMLQNQYFMHVRCCLENQYSKCRLCNIIPRYISPLLSKASYFLLNSILTYLISPRAEDIKLGIFLLKISISQSFEPTASFFTKITEKDYRKWFHQTKYQLLLF